ncbi:MAG: preprotein translocase subunit SecY [Clostridia bacterium]|nr:preprotein translocase subunit SecY [Clostridia bacterium]
MIQTLKNAWKIPELKKKLLFTLLIVLLYRLGASIPVPYIDAAAMDGVAALSTGFLQYLNIMSGSAFAQATLFALSVSPYITASIVIQLLTIAIPALERWSKDGEEGRKKISALTRFVTVALALVTSYGYMNIISSPSVGILKAEGFFEKAVVVACYCAGASLIMWLAEKINEHGIGNGISIILFANILSGGWNVITGIWNMITSDSYHLAVGILLGVVSIAITLAFVVLVVLVTNSERRIPIQYAKRVVGRKMYGGQNTNLPIKINMSGVMPIIFASSIVSIPATIQAFAPNWGWLNWINDYFSYDSWIYLVVNLLLIVAFSYFYIMISFNPVEVANNIKNNGGAIPGVRTGKPTVDFINKILSRITFIGAIFLCIVAGFPMLINILFGGSFTGLAFGGNSLLIVVGVALETVRELEAQITMRNYKGFLD